MEEAAFAARNMNYRYLKIKVLSYLDELSPAAEIIGAVNTVIHKEGKLYGKNTDGKGFVIALKETGGLWMEKTLRF